MNELPIDHLLGVLCETTAGIDPAARVPLPAATIDGLADALRRQRAEIETLRRERDALCRIACAAWLALDYFHARKILKDPVARFVAYMLRIGEPTAPVVRAVRQAAGLDP